MRRDLLLMAMESLWLLALLLFVATATPDPTPVLWALGFYPLAYGLARLIVFGDAKLGVELSVGSGLLIALLVLAWVLIFPLGGAPVTDNALGRFITSVFVATYGWCRGWWRAREPIDARGFLGCFQFGLAIMAACVFGLARLDASMGLQAGLALAYGAVGLVGLGVGDERGHGWGSRAVALLLGLGAVATVAAVLTVAVDRTAVDAVWNGGQAAFHFVFIELPAYLASLLPDPGPLPPPSGEPIELVKVPEEKMGQPLPEPSTQFKTATFIIFGFAMVMTIVLTVRFLRELFAMERPDAYRYGETGGWRALLAAIAAWFAMLGRPVMRLLAWLRPGSREPDHPGSVTDRYGRALGLLARRGRRRQVGETPAELAERLAPSWRGGGDDFVALTVAFSAERYGATPASPDHVETLWLRLRPRIRRIRRRG